MTLSDRVSRAARTRPWAALLAGAAACAGGEDSGSAASAPAFDAERAYASVVEQVGFGPRVPGSDGHARQLGWMLARLDSLAPEVVADTFEHVTESGDTLRLTNLLARFVPGAARRIVLLAHWDTRPTADEEADPEARVRPIPGANDGASGVAVLLELARMFAASPPPMGVDLLFVDGEDYGPTEADMFVGARRYAATLPDAPRPVYGVLLDMVGDAQASFPAEALSFQYARAVQEKLWRAADRVGHGGHFPRTVGPRLYDDHVPLIEAGVPTVDVIDFEYGPGNAYWHTLADTPERLSAATLAVVGEVVAELVYSGG